MTDNIRTTEWILRVGIAGEFLGHGMFALLGKESFITMIVKVLGTSPETAGSLLLAIGITDVLVALLVLVWPFRALLIWAVLWGFLTALARPLQGDPIWDFVERWANIAAPLALLWLRGLPRSARDLFT